MTEQEIEDDSPFIIRSPEEMFSRPAFVKKLRVDSADLDRIVAGYEFPRDKWVTCGLNGCPREHGKGYLIITKDGRETNCGHVCGKREFGVAFDEMQDQFVERQDAYFRERLLDGLNRRSHDIHRSATELLAQIEEESKKVEVISEHLSRCDVVFREFRSIVSNGGRVQVDATTLGVKDSGSTRSGGSVNLVTVGTIRGGARVFDNGRSASALRSSVIGPLEEILSGKAVQDKTNDQIKEIDKTVADMRDAIQLGQKYVSDARALCSPDSLENLAKLDMVFTRRMGRTDRALRAIKRLVEHGIIDTETSEG